MRLLVRKDVFIQIYKSLFNSSDHPRGAGGKFIMKFAPDTGHRGGGLTKQNSGIDQTKLDALECNTAIELKHIPFLKATLKDYYNIGTSYIKNLNKDLEKKELKCRGTGQKIAKFTYKHLYKNARTEDEKLLRTKFLPYVVPTITKGKKGSDSRPMDYGNSVCMLSKIPYIDNGIERKVGLKVVLAPDENDNLQLDFISVITIESPLIKSIGI